MSQLRTRCAFKGLIKAQVRTAFHHDPQLRTEVVALDAFEDGAGLGVESSRKPPGRDLDAVSLHRRHFVVE